MKIAFIVNGGPGSAMGIRAQSFAERLSGEFEIRILYRSSNKVHAICIIFADVFRFRPALCYVFDMGFSGVLAAGLYRAFSRCRVVVDTGDAIYELARSVASRGTIGLWLTKQLERFAFSISDGLVVRSHPHQELLACQGIRADAIPDGVDLDQFQPQAEEDLRRALGFDGAVVVGILGSLVWNQRWQTCYGWEVVEVVHRMRGQGVKGLVIGDGTGLERLKARCSALGIEGRVVFAGRVPYEQLPKYLNVMDVCISTQSNDPVGQVRTSGKLPLYLACGRFVLATDVGEAARVLPREMLVRYDGTSDPAYPARLVERMGELFDRPRFLRLPDVSVAIARQHFNYNDLAARVGRIIRRVLQLEASDASIADAQSRARIEVDR